LTLPKEEGGLGFRDLHVFNMAMLAKQCWRLLMKPDSLCAQILRARYYPAGDVLKASANRCMSYSWRSMLAGLEVIKQGLIWRVGDGTSIDIWADEWLPREHLRRPYTPRRASLLSRVNDLMDPVTGTWDAELVRDTFWDDDAELILSLPVHEGMDDILAWHYNKNGIFTVKSAYKVHYEYKRRNRVRAVGAATSSGTRDDRFWKELWKITRPRKMVHFMWRFSHNSLALRVNLKRRGMKLDTRCVLCRRYDEDGGHLFFKCKYVKGLG